MNADYVSISICVKSAFVLTASPNHRIAVQNFVVSYFPHLCFHFAWVISFVSIEDLILLTIFFLFSSSCLSHACYLFLCVRSGARIILPAMLSSIFCAKILSSVHLTVSFVFPCGGCYLFYRVFYYYLYGAQCTDSTAVCVKNDLFCFESNHSYPEYNHLS